MNKLDGSFMLYGNVERSGARVYFAVGKMAGTVPESSINVVFIWPWVSMLGNKMAAR